MKDYLYDYYIKYLKSSADFKNFCSYYHLSKKIFRNYISQKDVDINKLCNKNNIEYKRKLYYNEYKNNKLIQKDTKKKIADISGIVKENRNANNYKPKMSKRDIRTNAKQIEPIIEYVSEENRIEHCIEIKYYI